MPPSPAAPKLTARQQEILTLIENAIAHTGAGMFVGDGGPELVIAIGAGALFMAALGSGRFSVDAVLASRRAGRTGDADAASATTGNATRVRA